MPPAMLAEAAKAATDASLPVRWVCAPAKTTGLADGAFDAIGAGRCWHGFDRPRVAAEVFRLLRPGGRMVIVYFTYIAQGDTVGAATEDIVLRHNPGWVWARGDGPSAGEHVRCRAPGQLHPRRVARAIPRLQRSSDAAPGGGGRVRC